ncbi:HmuY family protein [Marinobacter salexigens]|uniref:HmuY family protein n=1 Tax=Marinobacter salexigens TaxID=1925763 RepID=UPI000C295951|nr:HmuY family protein [Marinobacter salexigens]
MNTRRIFLGLAVSAVLMSGCGGSDNTLESTGGGSPNDQFSRKVVDATSNNEATYLNLDTGKVVELTEEEAKTSSAWHLSFKRDAIEVNNGVIGGGKVKGAVVEPQDKFYTSSGEPKFDLLKQAAENDSEKAALTADYSAPDEWYGGEVTNRFGDKWFTYDRTTHSVVEDSSVGWLVRSAEGNSYARMRVEKLKYDPKPTATDNRFSIRFDVQPEGTEQFTNSNIMFEGPLSQLETCFDFDAGITGGSGAGATVDCATSDLWDIKLVFDVNARSLELRTNSGASGDGNGGALGEFAWTDLKEYGKATEEPVSGKSLVNLYAPDASGVFNVKSWYAYDQDGGHLLRPNFRVYAIDTDSTDSSAPVYAVQIAGYYGDDAQSGQPIVRWTEASLTEGEN